MQEGKKKNRCTFKLIGRKPTNNAMAKKKTKTNKHAIVYNTQNRILKTGKH